MISKRTRSPRAYHFFFPVGAEAPPRLLFRSRSRLRPSSPLVWLPVGPAALLASCMAPGRACGPPRLLFGSLRSGSGCQPDRQSRMGQTTKKAGRTRPFPFRLASQCQYIRGQGPAAIALCGADVVGGHLAAATISDDFEVELLALDDGVEACALDCGNVDKDVCATFIGLDEAEATCGVEEFYGSGLHDDFLPIGIVRPTPCRALSRNIDVEWGRSLVAPDGAEQSSSSKIDGGHMAANCGDRKAHAKIKVRARPTTFGRYLPPFPKFKEPAVPSKKWAMAGCNHGERPPVTSAPIGAETPRRPAKGALAALRFG